MVIKDLTDIMKAMLMLKFVFRGVPTAFTLWGVNKKSRSFYTETPNQQVSTVLVIWGQIEPKTKKGVAK